MIAEKLKRFSLVPQLDRYPRIVGFAATAPGKALCVVLFTLLLVPFKSTGALFVGLVMAAFTAFPKNRFVILLLATTMAVLLGQTDLQWDAIGVIDQHLQAGQGTVTPIRKFFILAPIIALCALLHGLAKRKMGIRLSYPVTTSFALYVLLASLAYYLDVSAPVKSTLWALLIFYGMFIWFLAYSLREAGSRDQNPFWLQLGHYQPFWSPGYLPIPKGSANLKRIAAKTEEDAATCRLKGIKLLIWITYIDLFRMVLNGVAHGNGATVGGWIALKFDAGFIRLFFDNAPVANLWEMDPSKLVPVYGFALTSLAKGKSLGVVNNWLSMLMFFANDLMGLAIMPNLGVAMARMCGFMALRNIYNPFKARSLVDFWNRYNYYFKEFLLSIFYYPAYFSFFKHNQKARLLLATFSSVIVGNFIYHYVLHFGYIYYDGPIGALRNFHSFALYASVLTIALYFSQLRAHKGIKPKSSAWNTLRIFSFYAVLSIFSDFRFTNIGDNARFLLSLFGM